MICFAQWSMNGGAQKPAWRGRRRGGLHQHPGQRPCTLPSDPVVAAVLQTLGVGLSVAWAFEALPRISTW